MELREQLEKVEADLTKNEEKRKGLLEKKKHILSKIEAEDQRREAERNRMIAEIVQESFGEITEEDLEAFRSIIGNQAGELQRQKEQMNERNY